MGATSGIYSVVDQNTSSVTIAVNQFYIIDNGASLVTLTLPATMAQGMIFKVIGNSSGGWTIAQGAGQSIKIGSTTTTTGAGGSITSSNAGDCIEVMCIVANTTWRVLSVTGNPTIV